MSNTPPIPPISKVPLIRMELAAVLEPHSMADCMEALLDCIEAGAACSNFPEALQVTSQACRSLADRLDARAKTMAAANDAKGP